MSSHLVRFGRSWYVPVHELPGDRAVGGRPRAPGRARRPRVDAARRGRGGRRSCCADGVRRIVATGNGAAYYVAHALWLAALESARRGPPIVARAVRRRRPRARSAGGRATRCSRCPRRASSATWSRSRERAGERARAWRSPPTRTPRSPRAATATVLQHVASPARGHAHAGAGGRVRCGLGAVGGGDRRRRAAALRRRRARRRGARGRRRRGVGGRRRWRARLAGRGGRRRRRAPRGRRRSSSR